MRIDDFVSNISKYGLARNHRWTIMFGRNDVNNRRLSTMCQSVTIPGRGFETNEIRTYGPGRNIASSQTYGDELKMEFLCGSDMYERQIFSAWMDTMVNPITNNLNYYSSYICDATVKMYDMKNNLRYAVKFYELYPTSVETFDLTQSADNPWVTANVSFAYRKFVTLQADVAKEQGEEQQADTTNQETAPPPRTEPAKAEESPKPTVENPRQYRYYSVNGRMVTKEEYDAYQEYMEETREANRREFERQRAEMFGEPWP